MTTQLGTMKVVGIQDKLGYSLVTFEIPDDCKQFLIEHAMRDLLTKAAKETKEKFGSVLPETLDNQTIQVYNAHNDSETGETDDAGWIPNKGEQPVDDDVPVDVLFRGGDSNNKGIGAGKWDWQFEDFDTVYDITHWQLHKTND